MRCNVARKPVEEQYVGCTIAKFEVLEVDTRSGEASETNVMRHSLIFYHVPCPLIQAVEIVTTSLEKLVIQRYHEYLSGARNESDMICDRGTQSAKISCSNKK